MTDVEILVLSRILNMQNFIHASRGDNWMGEVLTKTLLDVPGINANALYLEGSLIAHADEVGGDYKWPVSVAALEVNLDIPKDFVIRHLPLKTSIKTYGIFIIVVEDEQKYEHYHPFIINSLNIVSLVIENRQQQQKLQDFNRELQIKVDNQVKEIKDSRTQLRQLFDEAVCGIALGDPQTGIITDCNDAFCELLKRDKSEIIGKHQAIFHVPEEHSNSMSITFKQHIGSKEGHTLTSRMVTSSGDILDVEIRARVIDLGGPKTIQAFFTDITARKRAEEALEKSERKYRNFFTTVNNGWAYLKILTDENNNPVDYIFLEINPAYEKLTGLRREEVIGRKVTEVIPNLADDPVDWIRVCGEIALHGGFKGFETYSAIISKWIYISITSPAEGYFIVVVDDITDRKQAEEDLVRSKRYLQRIINYSPIPLVITDRSGDIEYFNRKFIETYGYTLDEITTSESWWQNAFPDPDYRNTVKTTWHAAIDNAVSKKAPLETQTWNIVCKDGSVRWVEVDLMQLGDKSVIAMNDITKHKSSEAERERLIDMLKEKTKEQERFIYTVSHDLKSPLVSISTFTGVVEEDLDCNNLNQAKKSLAVIKNAAGRMKKLLDDLLEISRIGIKKAPPEIVNLGSLIEQAIQNVSGVISGFNTSINIEPDLPDVMVDRHSYLQVFENLITNAVKYSSHAKEGSIIDIGIERNNNELTCFIRDNGIGIENAHKEKIFELFERLDPESEGTGVGLAIVKRIVEDHDGRIWAESDGPGQGSIFYFTLREAARY